MNDFDNVPPPGSFDANAVPPVPPAVEALPADAEPVSAAQTATETETETPVPPQTSVAQALKDGWKTACADAKLAAETGLPKIKAAVAKAAYGASYLTAYGTMFSATFVKELLPEPLKKGFSAGAKKATADAEAVVNPAPAADGANEFSASAQPA